MAKAKPQHAIPDIEFKCPNLEDTIRTVLGKPEGAITQNLDRLFESAVQIHTIQGVTEGWLEGATE